MHTEKRNLQMRQACFICQIKSEKFRPALEPSLNPKSKADNNFHVVPSKTLGLAHKLRYLDF